uniref:Endonuclease/exonuclease/phosphatase domain-containing protein n=1 Tax=Ursus americanus TaxID=9643 RepID=A0A452QAP6_URSAM
RGWSTIFHANGPQRTAGVAILISDKLDFKLQTIVRDAEGYTIGDLNTPLSEIDRTPWQKLSKESKALNAILNELDLIDIYRTLHPRTKEYSFYSNAHGTFSRIDHVLGHK